MRSVFAICALSISLGVAYAAGDATAGKAVYDKACKTCHGPKGEGNPVLAKAMNVQIGNLGSPEVQKMSDEDLKKIITEGAGKMRPVANVTGKSLDDVVAYVRTLKK
jgi:mono/diheme cytochrome c family protein